MLHSSSFSAKRPVVGVLVGFHRVEGGMILKEGYGSLRHESGVG